MTITALKKFILTTAALSINAGVFAAKPTSIKYIEDVVTESDIIYMHYQVKCSDGSSANISAWDNRKKWCVGKGRQDECSEQQIKSAKKVCQESLQVTSPTTLPSGNK